MAALPQDELGPVFNEPWQAHAFALAVGLSETGSFSWAEWSAHLSREIHAAQEQCEPNAGYYGHWLTALERLCVEKGLVNLTDMQRRREEWRRAYLNTPHGQPVELSAARLWQHGR